ncbi:pyocin knob domain-containing protein, partial [Ruminococcus sp.]|uniref:pyocin knob domain-containing protein n=1 Tax=Ruminococcus sp. TaxID=41978 RepID=UPI0025D570EA
EQGLMSAADKTKLDSIEEGANKTVVDTALSSTSTNPVQNKAVATALNTKSSTSHTHKSLAATTLTSENLNDIAMSICDVYQAQQGHTCKNAPVASYPFTLITTRISSSAKSQIAVYPHNNTAYMRSLAAGAWTDWTPINTVDTGWITLTGNVKYRKIGNIVEVRGTYTAPNSGGGLTIGTLPAGYRPSNAAVYNTNSINGTAANIYYTSVSTAGVLIISSMSGNAFTQGTAYNVNIMFMVD